MSGPATHLLWFDIETTGSSSSADIVEVGAVLTTTEPGLPIVAAYSNPVQYRDMGEPGRIVIHPWEPGALAMHRKNGLFDELNAGKAVPLAQVEIDLIAMLDSYVPSGRKVPLAGSGVGHFDRQFVDRDFPILAKRLTYWPIDVGVVRRMLQMAGRNTGPAPEKNHRALSCALHALDEGREYLSRLEAA